MDSHTFIILTP